MRRASLLFILAALIGASQNSHAQCTDDTDQDDGLCQKSRCTVICSGGGGITLSLESEPQIKALPLRERQMQIGKLRMSTLDRNALDGNPKDDLTESKKFDERQIPSPADNSEPLPLDVQESIRRRTL